MVPNVSIFKIIKAYRPHLWRVAFNLGDLNSNVQLQNCVNIVNMFRDHELLHPNISKLAGWTLERFLEIDPRNMWTTLEKPMAMGCNWLQLEIAQKKEVLTRKESISMGNVPVQCRIRKAYLWIRVSTPCHPHWKKRGADATHKKRKISFIISSILSNWNMPNLCYQYRIPI